MLRFIEPHQTAKRANHLPDDPAVFIHRLNGHRQFAVFRKLPHVCIYCHGRQRGDISAGRRCHAIGQAVGSVGACVLPAARWRSAHVLPLSTAGKFGALRCGAGIYWLACGGDERHAVNWVRGPDGWLHHHVLGRQHAQCHADQRQHGGIVDWGGHRNSAGKCRVRDRPQPVHADRNQRQRGGFVEYAAINRG